MEWMLDTNICIAIIRRRPEAALRRLRGKAIGQVGISSLTLAELQYGAAKSREPAAARDALGEFVLALEVAPFDDGAAAIYGEVRAQLESRGQPIGPIDTLIAAHALTLEAVLVTNNLREFRRVRGLIVEDWLS